VHRLGIAINQWLALGGMNGSYFIPDEKRLLAIVFMVAKPGA